MSTNIHVRMGGVMIQYYFTCPREVWFYGNYIDPPQDDSLLTEGRLIHRDSYALKGSHDITLGNSKFDILIAGKQKKIIEVKKSSKSLYPAEMQLKYYLWQAEQQKLILDGEIRIPKEKKVIAVMLTDKDRDLFAKIHQEIYAIVTGLVPIYVRTPYCKKCAYREFCEA